MTAETKPRRNGQAVRDPVRLACFLLGAIALYSSGIGLIEPKFHRAAGFALALIVGVSASRAKREGPARHRARGTLHLVSTWSCCRGFWAIWSFHFVQTQMETRFTT